MMGNSEKSSSFNFHGIMENTSGGDTCYSQKFNEPTTKHNESELFLHPPTTPMSYYPSLSIVSNKDGHVPWSTSTSCKIYSPQPYTVSRNETSDMCRISAVDYPEHQQINSDITLSDIEQMLMQDTDDKVRSLHGATALRTMEEPFYKLLGHQYPILPQLLPTCSCDRLTNGHSCSTCSVNISSRNYHSNGNLQAFQAPWTLSAIVEQGKQFPLGAERVQIGLNINGLSITENPSRDNYFLQMNSKDSVKHASFEVRGRKVYPGMEDLGLLQGRRNKQFAIFYDQPIRNEMFDKVLLCSDHKPLDVLPESVVDKSTKNSQNGQGRKPGQKTMRGKTRKKKEVVDLRTLLIHCAEAVSVNNLSLANDTLKTIRQHSSPSGDDSQRLAFYLADCLEIRLSGNGSQINQKFISTPRNAADILKLFHLCFTICPYLRASYYFSNKTILDVSKGKPRVHIIDFGICFGFQWPSLLKQFANREGGPPELRITGIEVPLPGFRPDEMNRNTWLRLVEYANMFKVPLEYQQISSKWEAISIEDLNIEEDEVLIVNCIHRMKNLGDETISINSARSRVLNTIRMMKPKVFIHGVVNGSYSTPFFLSRFKEVMYHYTALFDIFDKTTQRDNETRMMIESDIYRYAILNVIACEGSERTERPESYKKWKVRSIRARFEQLPLNPAIVKGIQSMVRQIYHKDFCVDEEDQYLVFGWKGRILYAISTWKPNESDQGDKD
uniref:Uncharacterized protein n=1 Tax=Avena sativa TaxID=4498 RepID=A0ACD5TIL7_AVESA